MARQVAGKDEDDETDVWAEDADAEERGADSAGEDVDLGAKLPPVIGPFDDENERDEEPVAEVPVVAGVNVAAGLEDVGGNVELYRNLLTKFRRDYIGAAPRIDSALKKGNIEVAHLLLHAVKGVASMLGAERVRDAADDLETKLIGSDPASTEEAVGDFTEALGEVLDSIGILNGDLDASSPSSSASEADEEGGDEPAAEVHVSDPMVLRSYLSGLRQHLLAEKPRQCQLIMREITARSWPDDYDSRVARLAELVDDGNFADARETFEDLVDQLATD